MINPDAVICDELRALPQPQRDIAFGLLTSEFYPFTPENHSEAHGEACFRMNTPANVKYKAKCIAESISDDATAGRLSREITLDYWLAKAIDKANDDVKCMKRLDDERKADGY